MGEPLVIVGGGQMGEALASGLVARGAVHDDDLFIVEAVATRRQELRQRHPTITVLDEVPDQVATAVVAVKPGDVDGVVIRLGAAGVTRVLSIAAGVTIERIERHLGRPAAVVRAMPNTPALVGAGVTAICAGHHATAEDLEWAETILGAVGTVVRTPESWLDAVTGLSGSGPAYVYLVAEALMAGGVTAGLSRDVAKALTVQLLVGAAALLAGGQQEPEALRHAVTSPGGTTAAGLRVLEQRAVRAAFIDAVMAATERSRELGR